MRGIRKNDLILIAGLLIIGGLLVLIMPLFQSRGKTAVVTINGEQQQSLSLNESVSTRFGTEIQYNVVEVRDGKVWVKEASCPDKLCMKQGKKSKAGEVIICLPNKFMVTVEGVSSQGNTVDVVAQ